jgi:hypothetical protein
VASPLVSVHGESRILDQDPARRIFLCGWDHFHETALHGVSSAWDFSLNGPLILCSPRNNAAEYEDLHCQQHPEIKLVAMQQRYT